jgi:DNA helicase HerA-like ATPase
MFKVTRELFHAETAAAAYDHLRDFLLTKEKNHCQRVEYLPVEVMRLTCEKLRADNRLQAKGVEAYLLAQETRNEYEIESGALIEKRNREEFGVLVAFIPQGLRLPAEDSYDIQTFKTYDLGGVLKTHVRRMIDELPADDQEAINKILTQPAVRRLSVDQHIRYLVALKHDGSGWEEAGAYLFHLNLVPDLGIGPEGLETHIDRNRHCVSELSNPDRTVISGIEKLVNDYGLDPDANQLRDNLIAFFRQRNVVSTARWLEEILSDENWRFKLTFDHWVFKDIRAPGDIEVHLDPLKDPKTGKLIKGLKEEAGNLIATTDKRSPLHLKWKTYPRRPENLDHYVILAIRDTDDEEAGEELVRRTVKSSRQSLRLSLKDVELDEGETCAAKILIHAKDKAGVILSSDESEGFWIEGQAVVEEAVKKVNRVRNRAEALFFAALKQRTLVELDSEGWESGSRRRYRLKLKNRDIYHIVTNEILHAVELRNITDPLNFGAWDTDARNRASFEMEVMKNVQVAPQDLETFQSFAAARQTLFERFQEKDPEGVVEVLDLREFKPEIMAYTDAYSLLLEEIRRKLESATTDGQVNNILNDAHKVDRIDTIHFCVGTSDDEAEVVLLAPTHPIKVLWVLQYQQLLHEWAGQLDGLSEEEADRLVSRESIDTITSLNIPSAIAYGPNEIYINSDNIDLYWSILPRGDSPDVRKVVSLLCRLLGQKGGGEITSITPAQLADKIWRYLKHHPYVSTLKLNVINPGDGLLVLNAIREIQRSGDFEDLNYDVALYGDLRYEVMGSAFDEMTEERVLTDGSQPDVDEDLLRPNRNPLFPKLTFSKQRTTEEQWKTTELRESHITILIDRFATKVLTRPIGSGLGSFCLHNLIAEYQSDFDLKGESATWSRKVVPNHSPELTEGDRCAEVIFKLNDSLLREGSCFYDWGNSLNKVPAIQLELSDTDKLIISKIHECSDWILTIDRNFGIEYFDNPRSAPGVAVRSYLIDYTPEFLEGVGHRLIVSTFWISEIEGLIREGLRNMGIPGTGFHAAQILDVLKSISGKLALKLINNPKDAREIIGLALTRLLMEQDGSLANSILIPVDSHVDLFAAHKRQLKDAEIRIHRNDLILAYSKDNSLRLRLIEVKFRSGSGSPSEEYELKEAIALKNADTQTVLDARFGSSPEGERLDSEIQCKQFASLLQFYFDRGSRHGLINKASGPSSSLQSMIHRVVSGVVPLEFEKAGYIYNLRGISKEPETYKDNLIRVIGTDRIREILEIPEDVTLPQEKLPAETVVVREARGATEPAVVSVEGAEPETEKEGRPSEPTLKPTDKASVETVAEVSGKKAAATERTGQEKEDGLRILLGTNYDTGRPSYWDPFTVKPKKLANQHILIVGMSGAGKTQSASSFIWELNKRSIPSVIFDFQGEYMASGLTNKEGETFVECTNADVLDAADGIDVNPLDIPIDPHTQNRQNYMKAIYQVSTSIGKIFGLGDIQRAILRDAISQAYARSGFVPGDKSTWDNEPPRLSRVWEILRHMETTEGGNVRNLNFRVQPLFETGVFLEGGGRNFDELLTCTSIVRLSNLATPELMVAVSQFVLQRIYATMLAQGPCQTLRVFAVVDEAHKLSYDETLTELIREARKYGVGILLASQSVKDFDRVVFDMVGTKIALHLEGEDAKTMADNLGLLAKADRDAARQIILHQPSHRALIRSNHFEPYVQADIMPFYSR